jgi:hypothetical protein
MRRTRPILACLIMSVVAAAATSNGAGVTRGDQPPQQAKAIGAARVGQEIGVQVVVVDEDQLMLPRALAGKYRGGLRVVNVVGPFARAAQLRAGDTIVAIGDVVVANIDTALNGLTLARRSLDKTRLTLLRGGGTLHAELTLPPPLDNEGLAAAADGGLPPERTRQAELLKRGYREKYDFLSEELREVKRLQGALGTANPRRAEIAVLLQRKLEQEQAIHAQQLPLLEKRLADLDLAVDDISKTDPDAKRDERNAKLVAAKAERDAVAKVLDALATQSERIRQRFEQLDRDAADLEIRQARVRILLKAVEGSTKELRQIQQEAKASE